VLKDSVAVITSASGAGSGEQADKLSKTSAAGRAQALKRERRINNVSEELKKLALIRFDSDRF
jgi:hypothetical protein